MRTFRFHAEIWLPQPLETVFAFFSDARNLEILTPPWLSFEVLTAGEIPMKSGTLIDYRLRLRGIPLRWQSEITTFEPPHCFVDEQRRGPYRLWVHRHEFIERNGGTLAVDDVEYAVHGGPLVNRFLVAPDLKRIFGYRHRKLEEIFGKGEGESDPKTAFDRQA